MSETFCHPNGIFKYRDGIGRQGHHKRSRTFTDQTLGDAFQRGYTTLGGIQVRSVTIQLKVNQPSANIRPVNWITGIICRHLLITDNRYNFTFADQQCFLFQNRLTSVYSASN